LNVKRIHFTKDITVFQLRSARAALGLTIAVIRKDLNISSQTFSKIEKYNSSGIIKNVSLNTISKIKSYYEQKGITFLEMNGILFENINQSNLLEVLNDNLEKIS
jgi:hypothetical protein